MRDRPSGCELLRQARMTLLEELSDDLPESRRYDVLMIANAMAIAARELETEEGRETERRALEGLLGPVTEDDPAAALEALNKRLAAEIRDGQRDGDAKTHALLSRDATLRLEISNPRALATDRG
jgi:hypothetical protein